MRENDVAGLADTFTYPLSGDLVNLPGAQEVNDTTSHIRGSNEGNSFVHKLDWPRTVVAMIAVLNAETPLSDELSH